MDWVTIYTNPDLDGINRTRLKELQILEVVDIRGTSRTTIEELGSSVSLESQV
jgi:hypothetical protein